MRRGLGQKPLDAVLLSVADSSTVRRAAARAGKTLHVYAVYMTYYMISFPSEAMVLSDEEFVQAGIDANAVDQEAKDAGVWMFSGGVDQTVEPVRVAADGTVTPGTYPGSRFNGGVMVLNLPDRAAAEDWARRIAVACRCDQEIRELM